MMDKDFYPQLNVYQFFYFWTLSNSKPDERNKCNEKISDYFLGSQCDGVV